MSSTPSIQEQRKAASADLASIGRVSHRIALIDTTERLEQVLDKLLPRLLKKIGENHKVGGTIVDKQLKETHDKIHAKLVELLSHVMKRVRDDQACKIPCLGILELLVIEGDSSPNATNAETKEEESSPLSSSSSLIPSPKTDVDPFTLNLSLAFLTLGLPRCNREVSEALLPRLIVLVGYHSDLSSLLTPAKKSQSSQGAHLLLRALERIVAEENHKASPYPLRKVAKTNTTPVDLQASTKSLQLARSVCRQDNKAAAALFDLLLDVLLYQPVSGNVPPAGLSQAGHERLNKGSSFTERDWRAEMCTRGRLTELKLAVLDFLTPNRRWAVFMSKDEGADWFADGISRTILLLVAASGDSNGEVGERASTYLKIHFDSFRGSSKDNNNDDKSSSFDSSFGNAITLSCAMLSLAVGQTNAESALSKFRGTGNNNHQLGVQIMEESTTNYSQQVLLSVKRRVVSETTLAALLSFVATKILDETPHALEEDVGMDSVQQVGTLSVMVVQRTLSNLQTSSGLSMLRAKVYVAAAQLLNILCIRLAPLLPSDPILDLLAKSLGIACSVLAPVSTKRFDTTNATAKVSNEGNIAVRDALYGVICSLSRSGFVLSPRLFSRGEHSQAVASVDTATLLFGCAANEEENLRPRAVAALDALLGAYCRVFSSSNSSNNNKTSEPVQAKVTTDNPWSSFAPVPAARTENEAAESSAQDRIALSKALLPLLWASSQLSRPKASRVSAARWSSDLLKELDLTSASHLLCFLAGDVDVTASSIAREGLGISKYNVDDITATLDGAALPDFGDFTMVLFQSDITGRPNYWEFSFLGKAAALKFGLVCLLNDMYGGEDSAVEVYMRALTETIALFGGGGSTATTNSKGREAIDLLDDCASCLFTTLSTSSHARLLLSTEKLNLRLEEMESLCLSANSSRARRHLAGACGHIYNDMSLWRNGGDSSPDLELFITKSQLNRPLSVCATSLTDMQRNIGEIHGAAFLGAQCVHAFRLQAVHAPTHDNKNLSEMVSSCWEQASKILSSLGKGTMHSEEIIGNAFADSLAIALSYNTTNAPVLDKQLYEGATFALVHLHTAITKYSGLDHLDPLRVSKLAHAAGVCLAASTSGAGFVDSVHQGTLSLGPARLQCADALFTLLGSAAFRKDEEIALVAGEALASYADAYSSNDATWSSQASEWPEEYSDDFANELPPHQQVLYVLLRKIFPASSPHKRTACAGALLAVVARAAREVNTDKSCSSRSMVKEIVEHLNEVQNLFITLLAYPKSKHLSRESCCLGLAACRGLAKAAVVTDMCDEDSKQGDGSVSDELNQKLLRAFGQTTNFGGSAMQETRAQASERRAAEARASQDGNTEGTAANLLDPYGIESEVGGASNMGEAALGAYREMASAAVSLGRPDILYALLILSVSHSVWFTAGPRERYSSSALLGEDSIVGSKTNAAEMRAALRPHLGKLLPRILRASNDPNKQTREQMSALWIGITGGGAESRRAITDHLLPTMDALVQDASNKLWRARVGACGALSEILVGRSWTDLGGGLAVLNDDDIHTPVPTNRVTAAIRLLRLWRVAMRALDDVRGNVRESGEGLSRTVRALSIRLCDPSLPENSTGSRRVTGEDILKHERDASSAAATTLRWLIKHGLSQPCAEATGFCVSCLVGIVDVVRPKILQPLIPGLLRSLLFAMSGLEPSAFNFLQVRTAGDSASSDSYDRLERLRLQMAQSGPLASAVTKCLDMLPNTDIESQRAVIPELDASLRLSAGFATRAATADAVSTLCATCPNAFRFSGSSNTNPSVRLLRALYYASERERGQAARDKMVHALGNLASVCPGSSVRSLATKACETYNASTGNNDDPASRRAAAAALRALAVRASNQFADGGQSDIWCKRVLPVAFLGRNDPDSKVASLWKEVWEEGGSAANLSQTDGASDDYGTTIQERLLPHLVSECAKALGDVSWSRRVAGSAALLDLCNTEVLSPAPRRLGTQSSSEVKPSNLGRAQRRSKASSVALKACVKLLMRSRLWTGKSEVLKAAVKIAGNWVCSAADSDPDELTLFGWEKKDGAPCPWKPITVSPGQFESDLFMGDNWFAERSPESDIVEEPDNRASPSSEKEMDIDESVTNEVKLDFKECDRIADADTEEIAGESENDPEDLMVEEKSDVTTFAGLCRFLIEEAIPSTMRQERVHSEEFLPYRASAFEGFRDLLSCLNQSPTSRDQKKDIYRMIAPKLIAKFDSENRFGGSDEQAEDPPLVVARSIDCVAALFWEGIGTAEDLAEIPTSNILEIARIMKTTGDILRSAWTVREASVLCVASVATNCHQDTLRQHSLISTMVECAAQALKDRKFWRVRFSGMTLLNDMVNRVGSDTSLGSTVPSLGKDASADIQERQLLLEAMLPHKEDILKLTKSSLSDPEAKITALSSSVISTMSWWP